MGINLVAALWGLAESTVFFIVPDVWLSIVGRKRLKTGMIACLYSLAGAMVGGVVMYLLGSRDLAKTSEFLNHIPAINAGMQHFVDSQLETHGWSAIILGPLTGTPYKIYASHAASHGIGFWTLMIITIPARLIRFMLVTSLVHYAFRLVGGFKDDRYNIWLLLSCWVVFYLIYFSVKGF